jgi:hypothetical protein
MFSNGQNQEWELFFFQVERGIIRNIIFLIKYIRKTRYLLASFFCYMRSIKKCIINYIFCIRTNAPANYLPAERNPSPFVTI